MAEVRISVIIPHYNSPKLLRNAISSAAGFPDVEILVVDDKSPLEESEFQALEAWCREHGALFLRNNTAQKGPGVCRNIGLDHAHGDWLLFMDADDFFLDGWYPAVCRHMAEGADIIYFPPTSQDLSTGETSNRHMMYEELVSQCRKNPSRSNVTELKYSFCTPWSKLFSRSLVESHAIRYDDKPVSQDIMFVTKCAYYAKNISAASETIYCVTRSGSTLTSKKSEENYWIRIDVLCERYAFLEEHLNARDFYDTHIGQYVFGQIVCVIEDHFGLKALVKLLRIYREHHMGIFRAGFLDVKSFVRKAKMLLLWFSDIRKSRKTEDKQAV